MAKKVLVLYGSEKEKEEIQAHWDRINEGASEEERVEIEYAYIDERFRIKEEGKKFDVLIISAHGSNFRAGSGHSLVTDDSPCLLTQYVLRDVEDIAPTVLLEPCRGGGAINDLEGFSIYKALLDREVKGMKVIALVEAEQALIKDADYTVEALRKELGIPGHDTIENQEDFLEYINQHYCDYPSRIAVYLNKEIEGEKLKLSATLDFPHNMELDDSGEKPKLTVSRHIKLKSIGSDAGEGEDEEEVDVSTHEKETVIEGKEKINAFLKGLADNAVAANDVKLLETCTGLLGEINEQGYRLSELILSYAVQASSIEALKFLLEEKREQLGNIDQADRKGLTQLYVACERLDVEAIALLLESGADPNIQGEMGAAALHAVFKNDNLFSPKKTKERRKEIVKLFKNTAQTLIYRPMRI